MIAIFRALGPNSFICACPKRLGQQARNLLIANFSSRLELFPAAVFVRQKNGSRPHLVHMPWLGRSCVQWSIGRICGFSEQLRRILLLLRINCDLNIQEWDGSVYELGFDFVT